MKTNDLSKFATINNIMKEQNTEKRNRDLAIFAYMQKQNKENENRKSLF